MRRLVHEVNSFVDRGSRSFPPSATEESGGSCCPDYVKQAVFILRVHQGTAACDEPRPPPAPFRSFRPRSPASTVTRDGRSVSRDRRALSMHFGPGVPFLRASPSAASIPSRPGRPVRRKYPMPDAPSARSGIPNPRRVQAPASREVARITAPRPWSRSLKQDARDSRAPARYRVARERGRRPPSSTSSDRPRPQTIPVARRPFALNRVGRAQLAALLGIAWDSRFALLGPERAAESTFAVRSDSA